MRVPINRKLTDLFVAAIKTEYTIITKNIIEMAISRNVFVRGRNSSKFHSFFAKPIRIAGTTEKHSLFRDFLVLSNILSKS